MTDELQEIKDLILRAKELLDPDNLNDVEVIELLDEAANELEELIVEGIIYE